ncbi:MAG TPA: MBL fold metallo-hydrolase [Bryobacteraceae bacterium]|nr:MBL fold metallo-hydrolase [Bryobacteraceae bacterium]
MASSSAGNSTLVATERTRLLIDAGLSRKETFERLTAAGIDPQSIDAILITHEHTDHVSGLQAIARKLDVPVYLSLLTAPAITWGEYTPKIEMFPAGSSFTVGDIDVTTFTIPHDAVDPVGFSFRAQGIKISIATDLGYLPDSIRFHLCGSDVLLLESNHDLEMLKVGPYPWSVKQRVMGRMGHLSNDVACRFVRDHLDTTTSTLILGHLSEHNNHPEIVRLMASQALNGRSLFTRLIIADPKQATETVTY